MSLGARSKPAAGAWQEGASAALGQEAPELTERPPFSVPAISLPAPETPPGTPNRVDYRIEASVDAETKELTGKETIRFTNQTREPVSDLWFHLYLNAFSNNRSTHLVESRGTARGRPFKESWGWSQVTAVRINDFRAEPVDVFGSFRYRRPDDGNEDDRTVFSVDLPSPVAPGETIEIDVAWQSQLPRVRRRTGYKGNFLLVAQWFPKLGVWEGENGWNAHQFHASTEFYSDYGTYDVTLDLPKEYEGKVFGSGGQPSGVVVGDTVTTTFHAPSLRDRDRTDHTGRPILVHDFTWTADPDYVVDRFDFRPAEWLERFPAEVAEAQRAFGPDWSPSELREVRVTVLTQPEHHEQAERHFEATATALFFYGLWFGAYPYEHITVVDPAWGAGGAGGMEYPTLFTCGTRLFTDPTMYTPESVTVHEAGHQFWYGLVGNNEFESAWLDEGFNSYTDSEALVRRYGPQRQTTDYARVPLDGVRAASLPGGGWMGDLLAARKIPLPILPDLKPLRSSGFLDWYRDQPALTLASRMRDPRWGDRTGYLRNPWIDPIDTNGWEYETRQSYGTNSYPRPAVALRTLSGLIGREAFLRGMRHYSESFRYRHPKPEDFFATFQRGAGTDGALDWYFADLFQGTGTVDWSVTVSQKREPEAEGFFQEGETGAFVERKAEDGGDEADGDGADEVEDEQADETDDDGDSKLPWVIEIHLRREGDLRLPLPVRMTFADGSVQDFLWTREQQAEQRWLRSRFTSENKLKSVELDPGRRYFIDADMSNDQWYDDTDEVAPLRWSERVFSQFVHLLHWQGRIGG